MYVYMYTCLVEPEKVLLVLHELTEGVGSISLEEGSTYVLRSQKASQG